MSLATTSSGDCHALRGACAVGDSGRRGSARLGDRHGDGRLGRCAGPVGDAERHVDRRAAGVDRCVDADRRAVERRPIASSSSKRQHVAGDDVRVGDERVEGDGSDRAGLDLDGAVARDRWTVGRGEHAHDHRSGDDVAVLVVDGVGERRPPGEAGVRRERRDEGVGGALRRGRRAAASVVATGVEQLVAVGIGDLVVDRDRHRLPGRGLQFQRHDRRGEVVGDDHGHERRGGEAGGIGDRVAVLARLRTGDDLGQARHGIDGERRVGDRVGGRERQGGPRAVRVDVVGQHVDAQRRRRGAPARPGRRPRSAATGWRAATTVTVATARSVPPRPSTTS